MISEHDVQSSIRAELSPYCILFRINVYKGKTADGRWIETGVPTGYSDLSGFRKSDGRAVFIEVKNEKGKVSKAQMQFLEQMRLNGAIAGVCRSVDDALKLIGVKS